MAFLLAEPTFLAFMSKVLQIVEEILRMQNYAVNGKITLFLKCCVFKIFRSGDLPLVSHHHFWIMRSSMNHVRFD